MDFSSENISIDSTSNEDSEDNETSSVNPNQIGDDKSDGDDTTNKDGLDEIRDSVGLEVAESKEVYDNLEANTNSESDPQIGMTFLSEEHAYNYYNTYARRKGFSIRKGQIGRRADKSIRFRIFYCSKEGSRPKCAATPRRYHAIERTNCMARIIFKVNRDNTYVVSKFIAEHNHSFAAIHETYMLRSQRKVLTAQAKNIIEMDKSGLNPSEAYNYLVDQANGVENIGFLSKDHQNFLRTQRMKELEAGDAQVLLNFLKAKQSEDPAFFYAIQIDAKGQLTNFFWADSRAIVDYSYFGDVISFDTTYRTNRYAMPFAPFLGINQHKQTIIFGAGLLLDESVESFVWLFETFKNAMSGQQPKTVFSDQSAAISKALSIAFPESCHRLCLWHIFQNAAKHLSHIYSSAPNFQWEFKNCIYEGGREEDFHEGWKKLLEKYGLIDNPWLDQLYRVHQKWALVYRRNSFCATMTTTQRSESMNNQFKKYFNKKLTLTAFIKKYEKCLSRFRQKEVSEDYRTNQSEPILAIPSPMLQEAAKTYSRQVYRDFEEEYKSQLLCYCELISGSETIYSYKVSHPGMRFHGLVEFDRATGLVKCSCKKFEAMGILCMHALKVLNQNNIFHLAPEFILKRWTRNARDGIAVNAYFVTNSEREESLPRLYNHACHKALTVAAKIASSRELLKLFEEEIEKLNVKVENALRELPVDAQVESNDVPESQHLHQIQLRAPPVKQQGRKRQFKCPLGRKKRTKNQDTSNDGGIGVRSKGRRRQSVCNDVSNVSMTTLNGANENYFTPQSANCTQQSTVDGDPLAIARKLNFNVYEDRTDV